MMKQSYKQNVGLNKELQQSGYIKKDLDPDRIHELPARKSGYVKKELGEQSILPGKKVVAVKKEPVEREHVVVAEPVIATEEHKLQPGTTNMESKMQPGTTNMESKTTSELEVEPYLIAKKARDSSPERHTTATDESTPGSKSKFAPTVIVPVQPANVASDMKHSELPVTIVKPKAKVTPVADSKFEPVNKKVAEKGKRAKKEKEPKKDVTNEAKKDVTPPLTLPPEILPEKHVEPPKAVVTKVLVQPPKIEQQKFQASQYHIIHKPDTNGSPKKIVKAKEMLIPKKIELKQMMGAKKETFKQTLAAKKDAPKTKIIVAKTPTSECKVTAASYSDLSLPTKLPSTSVVRTKVNPAGQKNAKSPSSEGVKTEDAQEKTPTMFDKMKVRVEDIISNRKKLIIAISIIVTVILVIILIILISVFASRKGPTLNSTAVPSSKPIV